MSTLPPAGWYPDETQTNTVRYWDGAQWTEQRAPQPVEVQPVARELPARSLGAAYAWLVFLGSLGAHRRYLVRNGSANAMLFLCVGSFLATIVGFASGLAVALEILALLGRFGMIALGIWCVVDLFLLPRITAQTNYELAEVKRRERAARPPVSAEPA